MRHLSQGLLQKLKLELTPLIYKALSSSLRYDSPDVLSLDLKAPVIFACLHRDMLLTIPFVAPAHPSVLVSRSRDGDILIQTLSREGFDFVRGSTGKEGGAAFRALLERIKVGRNVGIAVDGPRGPFGHVHQGVVRLAALSGAPIIPLLPLPGRHHALQTWDRTVAPWPFSRIRMRVGEPMIVPPDSSDLSAEVQRLQAILLEEEVAVWESV